MGLNLGIVSPHEPQGEASRTFLWSVWEVLRMATIEGAHCAWGWVTTLDRRY